MQVVLRVERRPLDRRYFICLIRRSSGLLEKRYTQQQKIKPITFLTFASQHLINIHTLLLPSLKSCEDRRDADALFPIFPGPSANAIRRSANGSTSATQFLRRWR